MEPVNLDPLAAPAKKRWPLVAGPLLGAAVIAVVIASLVVDASQPRKAVRVGEVKKGEVNSRVLAQGRVRAKRQVEVGSEITGRVTEVKAAVGAAVKVGDLLFTLDDEQSRVTVRQLRVALRAAEAMLERARLAADEATRNKERDLKLKERGVLAEDAQRASAVRADLVLADLKQAEAAVERARLDLFRAEDALEKAKVKAPIDGTVVAVNVEVGQVAAPVAGLSSSPLGGLGGLGGGFGGGDPGATVVIADLSEIIARLDVDELDVAQVKEGQAAALTAQGRDDERYSGEVTLVGLMGRDVGGAVQFPVEAKVSVPAGEHALKPGMSVSADIVVERLEGALYAPVAAVLEGDGEDEPDRVFVFDDGIVGGAVARERKVKLGPTDDEIVAVLEGLAEGERVVEGPFRTLKALEDGDALELEEEKAKDKDDEGKR